MRAWGEEVHEEEPRPKARPLLIDPRAIGHALIGALVMLAILVAIVGMGFLIGWALP